MTFSGKKPGVRLGTGYAFVVALMKGFLSLQACALKRYGAQAGEAG